MKKISKNEKVINKILKGSKFVAIPLSIIMITSGLSACSNNNSKTESTSTSVSQQTDNEIDSDEESVIINIDDREYRATENEFKYTIVKGDNLWSIARDFNLNEEDLITSNNLESDLIYPGDEIVIPKTLFKDEKKPTGIEVGQENGKVNWELTSEWVDFALIDVANFEDGSKKLYDFTDYVGGMDNVLERRDEFASFETTPIDTRFVQNMEESEKYGVPQGIVVHGNLEYEELNDAEKIGASDADTVIKTISNYTIEYPVVLDIDDYPGSAMDYAYSSADEYEDEFDKPISELCEDYCLSFMQAIENAGYYPMICTSQYTYDAFKKNNKDIKHYSKIIYAHDYDERGFGYYYDKEKCEVSRKMNGSVPGLSWKNRSCPIYIDNTKKGMDKVVEKKLKNNGVNNKKSATKKETNNQKSKGKKILLIGGILLASSACIIGGRVLFTIKTQKRLNGISYSKKRRKKK